MPKETKGLFSFGDIANIDFLAFLSTIFVIIGFIIGICCLYSAYLVPGSIVCAVSLRVCIYYLEDISVNFLLYRMNYRVLDLVLFFWSLHGTI